jgi:predicted metal-dependent hydrolase
MGIPVEYLLIRKRIKNINLRISEKEEITVSAPLNMSIDNISDFVEEKAEWILRNLAVVERYNENKPDSDVYSGKKAYFLGSEYEFRIFKAESEGIDINGKYIDIFSPYAEKSDDIKKQYLAWLEKQAETTFDEIVKEVYFMMKNEGINKPDFVVKNMKTRWGSCNMRDCRITLNLQLMKADRDCIKQVVCHEFTHLRIPNHSHKFYACLEKYIPQWKIIKKRLDTQYKDGI